MAIYPVKNIETGETKVVEVSIHEIMDWYDANPLWKRDWSQGCASPAQEGEWKTKLANKNPGWRTILDRVKAAPKSTAKDLY